jgi:hypothetical protein
MTTWLPWQLGAGPSAFSFDQFVAALIEKSLPRANFLKVNYQDEFHGVVILDDDRTKLC